MEGNDLQSVTNKLVEFLLKKNLFDEFKKQYAHEKAILSSLREQQSEQPPKRKKKKSGKRKAEQAVQYEQEEQAESLEEQLPKQPQDPRWLELVSMFEELTKDQYYLFEGCYYKLKSAKATRFQCSFRLDTINTHTSKREEVFVSGNKQIFWVSTAKLPVERQQDRYVVRLEQSQPQQSLAISNQQHLQLINKYWNKVQFFAVLPTDRQRKVRPEIVFIEFDYE